MGKMDSLALERERYARALENDLRSLVLQLSAVPAVSKVILFGSYASGRRDLFTDLDLLVVMDSSLDFVGRTAYLSQKLHASVALDLLVYTPEELLHMRHRPFIRQALETGDVLYERRREG